MAKRMMMELSDIDGLNEVRQERPYLVADYPYNGAEPIARKVLDAVQHQSAKLRALRALAHIVHNQAILTDCGLELRSIDSD